VTVNSNSGRTHGLFGKEDAGGENQHQVTRGWGACMDSRVGNWYILAANSQRIGEEILEKIGKGFLWSIHPAWPQKLEKHEGRSPSRHVVLQGAVRHSIAPFRVGRGIALAVEQ